MKIKQARFSKGRPCKTNRISAFFKDLLKVRKCKIFLNFCARVITLIFLGFPLLVIKSLLDPKQLSDRDPFSLPIEFKVSTSVFELLEGFRFPLDICRNLTGFKCIFSVATEIWSISCWVLSNKANLDNLKWTSKLKIIQSRIQTYVHTLHPILNLF